MGAFAPMTSSCRTLGTNMAKQAIKKRLQARRLSQGKAAVFRRLSLPAMKKMALKRAASASSCRVDDVRKSFGFFPSDVEAKVLSWPEL